MNIVAIDLKIPLQVFKDELKTYLSEYENNTGEEISYNITSSKTRSGKQLYKIYLNSSSVSGNELEVYCEQNQTNGNMMFEVFELAQLGSFYKLSLTTDPTEPTNPEIPFTEFMVDLCTKKKGTFGYIDSGNVPHLIVKGDARKKSFLAITDLSGGMYGFQTDHDAEDTSAGASNGSPLSDNGKIIVPITIPLPKWIQKTPEAFAVMNDKSIPLDEKGACIAAILIEKRLQEQITPRLFVELLNQTSSLLKISESNKTVALITKLFI